MVCPSCGVATQPDQRFCVKCGVALPATGSFPAPSLDLAREAAPDPATDPEAFDRMFDTDRFRVVEQVTPTVEQIGLAWDPDVALDTPDDLENLDSPDTAEVPLLGISYSLRLALVVLASLTAMLAVIASVVVITSYHVSGDVVAGMTVRINGFTSNALVGSIIAAVLLLVGAVLGTLGYRMGTGLAGGAGLAVAGLMAWTIGQAVSLVDTVKQVMRARGGNYHLVTKFDIGLWVAVAAALLGVVTFVVSLSGARDDGARRVHPAVGAIGAIGTLLLVVGPMLPMHTGTLADNFSTRHPIGGTIFWKAWVEFSLGVRHDAIPPLTTTLRLLLLLLLGVGGVLGFLRGSRWGLGLAMGSVCIAVWQWITSLAKAGDLPFGIAGGNPGSLGRTPHGVTSAGVVIVLVAIVAQAVLTLQSRRT